MDRQRTTFEQEARARMRRTLVCAATALALVAALAPAAATALGRAVSERTVRRLETKVLGPAHALDHALERRAQRRAIARWRALSPAARQRAIRAQNVSADQANDLPASAIGRWGAPFPLPVHGIHAAVLATGKVMIWSYPVQVTNSGLRVLDTHAYVWDPSKGIGSAAFRDVTPPADETASHAMIFCSGGSLLADGRLLITGGTLYWPDGTRPNWAGIKDVWTFNQWDETWTRQPDTAHGRWYPTQTELPDGRTLILGGVDESGTAAVNPDLEVFKAASDPHGVGSITRFPASARDTGTYPHLFTMPNGQVLLAGQRSRDSALLTPTTAGADGKPVDVFQWTATAQPATRLQGNAILEPGGANGSTRVTLVGGTNLAARDKAKGHTPPRETTQTLDIARPADGWRPAPSMMVARANFNTVLLPDGSLVAIGGSNGTSDAEGQWASWSDHRSRAVDIRDAATGRWRLGAMEQEDRAYHSTAVLLPDGRVLSGGDDRPGTRTSDTAEIYSPPYLFRGPRPVIGAVPSELAYGQPFRIGATLPPVAPGVRAVLMAPGVTTHGTEMQARHVELAIARRDASGVNAVSPPSAAVAPPGWYMLFLLSESGVPSVARWVQVK